MDQRILGLPTTWKTRDGRSIDLSVVPDGPDGPNDGAADHKTALWEAWHFEVLRYRDKVQTLCEQDHAARADELAVCKASPMYFIAVWCWVYETREDQTPFGTGWLPAIPMPYHVRLIDWLDRRYAGRGPRRNGLVSKSRDMGVTWYTMLYALHGFLFREAFSCNLISRIEELVDIVGDVNSMLERAACHVVDTDFGHAHLPEWMRPPNIDETKKLHRQHKRLTHTRNRNIIRGEATSGGSGRGIRAALGYIDEGAHIPKLRLVLAALRETVGHLIIFSSESVQTGETFVEYKESLKSVDDDCVLEIDYWEHFYHGAQWLADKEEEYKDDPAAFIREVLRDAYAGFSSWIYEDFRKSNPVTGEFPYEYPAPLYVGIDPGFDDDTAMCWASYDGETKRYRFVEAAMWRLNEPEFYAHILTGMASLPGKDEPAFAFSDADFLLMSWTETLPSVTLCGDPNGWNRNTGQNDSFYDRLSARYLVLAGRPLDIRTNWKHDKRSYQGRWAALRGLVRRADFNESSGVKYLINAIKGHRLKEDDGRGSSTEQKAPRHNLQGHMTTAAEFLAVNLEIEDLMRGQRSTTGQRLDPTTRSENFGVRTELTERVA